MPAKTIRTFSIGSMLVALGACGITNDFERMRETEWRPTGEQTFIYEAGAFDHDDPLAKSKTVAKWLDQYLSDNGMCPDGYEITDRQVVIRGKNLRGTIHWVYYTGQCTEGGAVASGE